MKVTLVEFCDRLHFALHYFACQRVQTRRFADVTFVVSGGKGRPRVSVYRATGVLAAWISLRDAYVCSYCMLRVDTSVWEG